MTSPSLKPIPRGPESVPLREVVTDLDIVVCVYNLGKPDDKPYRIEHGNFGDHEFRKWIGRITAWACLNGCSVETMAKSDWDKLEQ